MSNYNDSNENDPTETVIAYVYGGETAPDFAAIAASGFGAVALDNSAPWFSECMVEKAKRHGLIAVAFPMGYSATKPAVHQK
ncbi:MAG TPA: hypothetical protein VGP95_04860 [Gemmatimonadaceae bacterium]|nr:hypothetical protein [Gemmatimonadaceae bacterium]